MQNIASTIVHSGQHIFPPTKNAIKSQLPPVFVPPRDMRKKKFPPLFILPPT